MRYVFLAAISHAAPSGARGMLGCAHFYKHFTPNGVWNPLSWCAWGFGVTCRPFNSSKILRKLAQMREIAPIDSSLYHSSLFTRYFHYFPWPCLDRWNPYHNSCFNCSMVISTRGNLITCITYLITIYTIYTTYQGDQKSWKLRTENRKLRSHDYLSSKFHK